MGGSCNIPGAEKKNDISRPHRSSHRGPQLIQRADKLRGLPFTLDGRGQKLPADSGNSRLTGCVNLRDPKPVRPPKTDGKFLEQMQRSGEAMRLKGDQQPPDSLGFDGLDRRFNFFRMVTVIIYDAKTRVLKKLL